MVKARKNRMDRFERVDWWNWKWTAGILCTFGLIKEFQPSEPFFVDYARNHANFTNDEVRKNFHVLSFLFLTAQCYISDYTRDSSCLHVWVLCVTLHSSARDWLSPIQTHHCLGIRCLHCLLEYGHLVLWDKVASAGRFACLHFCLAFFVYY